MGRLGQERKKASVRVPYPASQKGCNRGSVPLGLLECTEHASENRLHDGSEDGTAFHWCPKPWFDGKNSSTVPPRLAWRRCVQSRGFSEAERTMHLVPRMDFLCSSLRTQGIARHSCG